MVTCKYCNDLDVPSYDTVRLSRKNDEQEGYDGLSAIPSTTPRGLKPHIEMALEDILYGAGVMCCDACTMLRDALLTVFDGSLNEVVNIRIQGSPSNTLDVSVSLKMDFRYLELYTLESKVPAPIHLSFSTSRPAISMYYMLLMKIIILPPLY